MWLRLACPPLGTQPTGQACALTGNQGSDSLVHRPTLSPLSHPSRGKYGFDFGITARCLQQGRRTHSFVSQVSFFPWIPNTQRYVFRTLLNCSLWGQNVSPSLQSLFCFLHPSPYLSICPAFKAHQLKLGYCVTPGGTIPRGRGGPGYGALVAPGRPWRKNPVHTAHPTQTDAHISNRCEFRKPNISVGSPQRRIIMCRQVLHFLQGTSVFMSQGTCRSGRPITPPLVAALQAWQPVYLARLAGSVCV